MHISDGILAPSVLAGGYLAAGGLTALGLRRLHDRDYPLVGVMTAAFFVAGLVRVPAPPTSVHLTLNSLVGIVLGVRCFPAILIALLLQAVLLGHGGLTTLGVNTVMMALPGFLAGAWMRYGLRGGRSGRLAFATVLAAAGSAMAKMLADALRPLGVTVAGSSWPVALAIGLAVAGLGLVADRVVRAGPWFRWGFAAGGLAVLLAAAMLFGLLGFAPLDRASEREALRDLARFAFVAHAPVVAAEGVIVGLALRYLAVIRPGILGIDAVPRTEAP